MIIVWTVFATVTTTMIGFSERIHGSAFAVSKLTIKYVVLFHDFSLLFLLYLLYAHIFIAR